MPDRFCHLTGPVTHKKTRSAGAKAGFENYHALAAFLKRPQAENQIGAELKLYLIGLYFCTAFG